MNSELKKRFENLEHRREAMVDRVRALSPERQKARRDPNAFSPLEVIQHFALAEEGNLKFLRENPPPMLQDKKPKTRFVYRMVVKQLRSADKMIRTLPSMVPKAAGTLDHADRQWAVAREELAVFLEQVDEPDEPFCKFSMLFGLGSADDYLRLMEAHMHYHEKRFPA